MNTAKMREKARYYESVLDWQNAANCWKDAIALLPSATGINALDAENMRRRMVDCQSSAKLAAQESCNHSQPSGCAAE